MKHPPGPGGMGDQPAALMEAFAMIDHLLTVKKDAE